MLLIWLTALTLNFGVQTSCPSAATARAKEHYSRGDYSGASAALADIEVCIDGSDEELAEAFRWRAQARASAGDTKGAIDAWALAWTVLPTYVLDPLESPKFHDQYAEGRKAALRSKLVFARLTRTLLGHTVVQVFDPHGRVKRVMVQFDAMEMNATRHDDGTWHALVPQGAVSAVAVLDSGDAVVCRTRKVMVSDLPVPVEERIAKDSGPFLDQRRVLIIAGAAAATVVIAAVVSSVALSSKHIDGSLGRVELP
jgi:hypothetical protein